MVIIILSNYQVSKEDLSYLLHVYGQAFFNNQQKYIYQPESQRTQRQAQDCQTCLVMSLLAPKCFHNLDFENKRKFMSFVWVNLLQ